MARETISFVATEELADWLESQAKERMTTVSSAAQQLLVEKYREQQNDQSGGGGSEAESSQGDVFDRHPSKWAVPDSQTYSYRVKDPDPDGRTRYYKTREGAEKRLKEWYE